MLLRRSIFIIFLMTVGAGTASAQQWREIRGTHFIVNYGSALSTDEANVLLRRAESYYDTVADLVGYARYSKFWTWDKRVTITVYDDAASFQKATGQPPWSVGMAERDWTVSQTKAIVTYKQEDNFFDGMLPHEISHLILHDFIGSQANVPRWFDEGVAQLQEAEKKRIAQKWMTLLIREQKLPPIAVMMAMNIKGEQNPAKIKIFYTQSLSLIDFLVTHYDKESFRELCRNLRDGKSFESALTNAYPQAFNSLADLERKWITSLKN